MSEVSVRVPKNIRRDQALSSALRGQTLSCAQTGQVSSPFMGAPPSPLTLLSLPLGRAFLFALLFTPLSAPRATPTPPKEAETQPNTQPKRTLKASALKRGERVQPDGELTEEAWARAEWSAEFVERSPTPGASPPVRTEVAALYDHEALYVAVRMGTQAGERPVAWELRRDRTSMWSDDAISLKLDPRSDERTSLVFVTNPAGAQLDFIALDNGAVFSVEHDALWEVGTSVQERAWVAEYRVPFASLLISQESVERGSIGFNLSHDHNARQATYDWSLLSPEFGPFSALHYGRLEGLSELKSARLLTLLPYVGLRLDKRDAGLGLSLSEAGGPLSFASSAQLGGELKLSLSPAEQLELTALTDFAQVDLDDPLINLNRFALYFPERRPFFINGLDVFAFGKQSKTQLFFSRRVGLSSQGEVPLYSGLKLYGRRGALRYGVLSAMTGEEAGEPARLFNVARGRYDFGQGSSIGLIAVNREALWGQREGAHNGVGVDARSRLLNTRLELSGFYALTLNEALDDDPHRGSAAQMGSSAGASLSWRGLNLRPSLSLDWVQASFDPVMGFVYRDDYAQAEGALTYLSYSPTPQLRSLSATLSAYHTRDASLSEDLGHAIGLSAQACSTSNWCFAPSAQLELDKVDAPFELAGLQVQPRGYHSWAASASLSAPSGRRFGGSLSSGFKRGYFGGWLNNSSLNLSAALSPHVRLATALNYARYEVEGRELIDMSVAGDELKMGELLSREAQSLGANLQLIVTPSPTLLLDAVTQLNSASDQLLTQARLRWRYLPGSDAFIVLRHATPSASLLEGLGLSQQEGQREWRLTFKLAWRYDQPL